MHAAGDFDMTTDPKKPSLFSVMAEKRKETAYALFGLFAVFAIIALVVGIRYRIDFLSVILWAALIGLVFLSAGVWRLAAETSERSSEDSMRLLVLAVGGMFGFITVVFLALGLTLKWWDVFTGGWEAWQGGEGWKIWVCLLAFVLGLMLMFLSLQLARSDEHSSSGFRRLLYGYNAVLASLLLFLILLVINVLVYIPWGPFVWFNNTYHWATASIYSLSSQSEKVLAGLEKPVKIEVVMPRNDPLYHPMTALLDNFRSVNPKIQVKFLSPDADQQEVEQLAKEHKFGGERSGVLLLYGSGDKVENRFIKRNDMISESSELGGRSKQPAFKGEIAIVSELNSLALGKEKPTTIYFTQGDGEPDLADIQRAKVGEGLGTLKDRLQAKNHTVKGLQFSPAAGVTSKNPDVVVSQTVPSDASLVVIVAPQRKFEKFATDALRNYMEPTDPNAAKGKLLVYLNIALNPEKTAMESTGLEVFLAEFGVQVNNDRILASPGLSADPQLVLAFMNPERAAREHNAIVDSFSGIPCAFYNGSRTVDVKPAGPQSNPRYRAELMMIVPQLQQQRVWAENNLQTDPVTLIKEFDRRGQLGKKRGEEDLPVAVAVTENIPGAAGGPHAMMPGEEKPRLIVFGNGALLSNRLVDKSSLTQFPYYDLFTSCVAWLRERPTNIGIEPKNRDYYAFPADANVLRMALLPAFLMIVSIIGLGTGVWVVRRR
jgi:hypothetical protein